MSIINYTENDLYLYRELLKASEDQLIKNLPVTVTKADLERLCDLSFCDSQTPPYIHLCYTSDEIDELEKSMRNQDAQDNQQKVAALAKERSDKKQRFRENIIMALISSIVTLSVEHIMDIIRFFQELF